MKNRNSHFIGRPELEALGVQCGGDDISVHDSTVLIDAEKIEMGNHVRIDPFCVVSAGGGIRLGDHIHIAAHCSLIGGGGIEVGDFAGISHGAKRLSVSDKLDGTCLTGPTVPKEFREVISSPILVQRHAVVGAGSIVLPGATIGEGAIIGALSLVRESVPSWTIWAGIPGRAIGQRKQEILKLEERLREQGLSR
jgi:galactoside O-acetyltransferase